VLLIDQDTTTQQEIARFLAKIELEPSEVAALEGDDFFAALERLRTRSTMIATFCSRPTINALGSS